MYLHKLYDSGINRPYALMGLRHPHFLIISVPGFLILPDRAQRLLVNVLSESSEESTIPLFIFKS